jgi:glutamate synthase (NADPH/NADH) large chain
VVAHALGDDQRAGVADAEPLADWDTSVQRFSKIIPSTYKAVLAAKDAAERAGLSETEITEKMMEAAING